MNRYTEEHKKFFLDFIPGHTSNEVAEEFKRRFNTYITPAEVYAYKRNHKIKSGTPKGMPKGTSRLFPVQVCEFLRANNKGKTAVEMAELLNSTFGTKYTVLQVKSLRSRMHLNSGLTGYFEKGCVSFNKGKKGVCAKGCEKGWFKKGHVSHNHVSVGTEVMATSGYLKIKIAEPDIWQWKHILEWEKYNGKVPDGYNICFKDGNRSNCNIANLMCISKAEHSVLNSQHLRSSSAEITDVGVALAKLKIKIRKISKGAKK